MLANRIERLAVKNYRSLGDVSVDLSDLTVLIGANGSGKSNLLDVLRFVRNVARINVYYELKERGGFSTILQSDNDAHPSELTIGFSFALGDQKGSYTFTLVKQGLDEFLVQDEEYASGGDHFKIHAGEMLESTFRGFQPVPGQDSLLLFITQKPEFTMLRSFLSNMGFYAINPDDLRPPQAVINKYPLDEKGKNLVAALRSLFGNSLFISTEDPYYKDHFISAFTQIVPDTIADRPLELMNVGSYLVGQVNYLRRSVEFSHESDGTLRALALLTALYQTPSLPLLGLEEPELMLHPQAMGVLADVIYEAASRSQVIVTTHSPDLISRFNPDSLRIVEQVNGSTQIGAVTEHNKAVINEGLFSGGDLLRIGGMQRA